MLEKIAGALGGVLKDRTVGILGLSFKPETDDVRDAPALDIVSGLIERGAQVRAYDPAAMKAISGRFPQITLCKDPYEVCRGADALVIVTEWNEFRMLDLERVKELMSEPILIDLRNIYRPEAMRAAGIHYVSVGRWVKGGLEGECESE